MCGADSRQEDIFSTDSLLGKGRSVLKGIKVIELIFERIKTADRFPGSRECVHAAYAQAIRNSRKPSEGPSSRKQLPFPGRREGRI
jgi:hypothetical protein